MKWKVTSIIIGILILGLSGCGVGSDQSGTENPSSHQEKQIYPDLQKPTPPSNNEAHEKASQEEGENDSSKNPKDHQRDTSMREYAPTENVIKYFEGTGNEFATYSLETFTMEDDLLATVSHSGTNTLKVYRIQPKEIALVYSESEFYKEAIPNLKDLVGNVTKEEVMLKLPLKQGAQFGKWTIKETSATVELPYGKVNDVIILKSKDSEGWVSLEYWAKKLGIVKEVVEHTDDNGSTFRVTSELKKVEQK